MLIIHKAFYNKGRFYFTDLHFQTPTLSFHSSDVKFLFFFPSIQCQTLKLRIVISAFNISMSLRTRTLSRLQDRVCYCGQAQMSPFHSLVSIPITSVSVPDYTYIIIRVTTCLYVALFCSHRQGHLTHSSLSSDHLSSNKVAVSVEMLVAFYHNHIKNAADRNSCASSECQ